MKVICIDAGNVQWCIDHGLVPLTEGKVYSVRSKTIGVKGDGYLLREIHNRCNILDAPGKEPDYLRSRFIPLSTINELELIENKTTYPNF